MFLLAALKVAAKVEMAALNDLMIKLWIYIWTHHVIYLCAMWQLAGITFGPRRFGDIMGFFK